MASAMDTDMAMVKKRKNKYKTIYNLFIVKESRKGLFYWCSRRMDYIKPCFEDMA